MHYLVTRLEANSQAQTGGRKLVPSLEIPESATAWDRVVNVMLA